MGDFQRAGDDFETARRLKPSDPNFAVDYKAILHVKFIEVDSDPDLTADFPTLADISSHGGMSDYSANDF
jgi:hypothetical protein